MNGNEEFERILQMSNKASLDNIVSEQYKVYGTFWDKSTASTLTRLNDARGATALAGLDNKMAVNEFDLSPLFRDFQEVTDSYGNKFIRIPKMYIGKIDGVSGKIRKISRKPFVGCYLPKSIS